MLGATMYRALSLVIVRGKGPSWFYLLHSHLDDITY
jgi:hypothetical protein